MRTPGCAGKADPIPHDHYLLRSFGLSSLEELPELPSAGPEDGQITLEMQAALEKLRGEQTENLTDEELLEAARELSATEADIPAAEE